MLLKSPSSNMEPLLLCPFRRHLFPLCVIIPSFYICCFCFIHFSRSTRSLSRSDKLFAQTAISQHLEHGSLAPKKEYMCRVRESWLSWKWGWFWFSFLRGLQSKYIIIKKAEWNRVKVSASTKELWTLQTQLAHFLFAIAHTRVCCVKIDKTSNSSLAFAANTWKSWNSES